MIKLQYHVAQACHGNFFLTLWFGPLDSAAMRTARSIALLPAASGALSRFALWLRDEPLVHFLAIGLALFALASLTAEDGPDPRRIVVDDAAYREIVGVFAETEGRAPDEAEIEPFVDRWIMNETLYREARALRLDEGDEMVRERIMQKLRVLMMGSLSVETPSNEVLRAWYEENRARYRQPDVLTLQIARIDGDEEQAAAAAARLNAVRRGEARLQPGEIVVVPLTDRPRPALEQVLGPKFVAAVEAGPRGEWAAVQSPNGWQAALFEAIEPGGDLPFEGAEQAVAADWREAEVQRRARAAMEALMASYRVDVAPYDPDAFAEVAAQAVEKAETAASAQP